MKKLFSIFALVTMIVLVFTACTKKSDNNPQPTTTTSFVVTVENTLQVPVNMNVFYRPDSIGSYFVPIKLATFPAGVSTQTFVINSTHVTSSMFVIVDDKVQFAVDEGNNTALPIGKTLYHKVYNLVEDIHFYTVPVTP